MPGRRELVDVVYGVRTDRSTDSAFKRTTARGFYRLMRMIGGDDLRMDAGDFRLMSRATVDAVNALPEHHRVVFVLRELEGKSYDEIADITGCNLGTVKSRLNRARNNFAAVIAPLLD